MTPAGARGAALSAVRRPLPALSRVRSALPILLARVLSGGAASLAHLLEEVESLPAVCGVKNIHTHHRAVARPPLRGQGGRCAPFDNTSSVMPVAALLALRASPSCLTPSNTSARGDRSPSCARALVRTRCAWLACSRRCRQNADRVLAWGWVVATEGPCIRFPAFRNRALAQPLGCTCPWRAAPGPDALCLCRSPICAVRLPVTASHARRKSAERLRGKPDP
jgi:hypothetical protein